jgi:peptide/nickel transport system ATP-binding protein
VFNGPEHPYSEALLAATIRPEQKGQALPTIPGFPPHAGDIDDGCRFAPRCRYAVQRCTDLTPPLVSVTDHRRVRCIRHDELDLDGVTA